jgi:hypothetical protein
MTDGYELSVQHRLIIKVASVREGQTVTSETTGLATLTRKNVKHSDFQIGMEFYTGAGKWRCTDIGARVIVAISLEPRETVRVHSDENGEWREERYMSNDPRDLLGPPYSVAEHVIDEYDLGGCYATADEVP